MNAESEIKEGDVEKVVPRFLSFAWFKNLATAVRYDKYSARDWAISTWSTIVTTAQFSGIGIVWTWLVNILPAGVVTAAKSVGAFVSAVLAGLAHVVFG